MTAAGGCVHPSFVPTRDNPTGDCRRPPARAVPPRGERLSHLLVCSAHADRYSVTIPLDAVPEEP